MRNADLKTKTPRFHGRNLQRGQAKTGVSRSVAELMNLSGRRSLVTGGTGHIGRIAAEALSELGATVAVMDVDPAACTQQAAKLSQGRTGRAVPIACDLSDEAMTRRAIRLAAEKLQGLDILVHCAAYVGTTDADGWACAFDEQTVEAWDASMRVNLTSAFVMAQEARALLAASGHGSVILLASIYGLVGPDERLYTETSMGHPAGYDASKGGLLQLTRYLASVLAPRVRVNAISPGGVLRDQPKAFQERYVARTPMARMATEEDVKGAVAYLASDLSAYVTGHNLVVDGGWTAW
ncbi:MAG: SDR family oxidoreductase [Candidatus Omnitrophica bacterium]|nr:SDR family oxidoreductase [Candidatus Omnitrophota bacterium]